MHIALCTSVSILLILVEGEGDINSIKVQKFVSKLPPRTHSFGLASQSMQSQLSSGGVLRRRTSINLQSMLIVNSNTNPDNILGKFAAPENQDFKAMATAILRPSA